MNNDVLVETIKKHMTDLDTKIGEFVTYMQNKPETNYNMSQVITKLIEAKLWCLNVISVINEIEAKKQSQPVSGVPEANGKSK